MSRRPFSPSRIPRGGMLHLFADGAPILRRYIDGLTVRQTAAAMMYSEPQLYVLQRRALARLAQQ